MGPALFVERALRIHERCGVGHLELFNKQAKVCQRAETLLCWSRLW